MSTTERKVEKWFAEKGIIVRDVQLVMDKFRRFKGFAYIEFYQISSVAIAISLSGSMFEGKSIIIEDSKAEKNKIISNPSNPSNPSNNSNNSNSSIPSWINSAEVENMSESYLTLFVGNLDYGITEDMIFELLSPIGSLENCKLELDNNGHSKGYAFVQYKNREDSIKAFYKINSIKIANRVLKCDFTKESRSRDIGLPQPQSVIDVKSNGDDFEKKYFEDENIKNNQSRHNLIKLLAASGSNELDYKNQVSKNSLANPGNPSCCIHLKNMFDPSTESNPKFEKEIEADVLEEALSFGPVLHIHVDKTSFVRF